MKKIIAAALTAVLLACLSFTSAGTAGTSSDPLVSKSYADSTYTESVLTAGKAAIDKGLQAVYDAAVAGLGSSAGGTAGTSTGGKYVHLKASSGGSVTLYTGSSIVLLSGKLTVSVTSGTVIEISSGSEIPSGTAIPANGRYFCAEDTTAVFTASADSVFMVEGAYTPGAGVETVQSWYTDVQAKDWFYSAAVYAHQNKIFPDYASSTFRPHDKATRAETVYALWMAVGSPASSVTAGFSDLTESWYMTAVSWAVENGIINGADNNMFMPDAGLTREQLAAIMYRYTAYTGQSVSETSDLTKFTDNGSISSWARDYMSWANAVGIITGISTTELGSRLGATRSQVAAVLMRYVAR